MWEGVWGGGRCGEVSGDHGRSVEIARLRVVGIEGRLPDKQLVDDHAESPKVDLPHVPVFKCTSPG